jgi:hypothetical protein
MQNYITIALCALLALRMAQAYIASAVAAARRPANDRAGRAWG